MDVGFDIHRKVEVDNVADIVDIEASGSDICSYEHCALSTLETVEVPGALVLTEISTEHHGTETPSLQLTFEPFRRTFLVDEHKELLIFILLQQLYEGCQLFTRTCNNLKGLLDVEIEGNLPVAHLNIFWILIHVIGEHSLHFLLPSRSEQSGLAFLR